MITTADDEISLNVVSNTFWDKIRRVPFFCNAEKVPQNRAFPEYVKIFHGPTGIQCTVCFQLDPPSTFIRDLLVANESCKYPYCINDNE